MRKHLLNAVALGVCALAGCGEDSPDILGLYETTEHLVSGEACSGGETPDPSTPYFRIVERELFGVSYYGRADCESTDEASCEDGSGLLVEEISNGYEGAAAISSGDTSSCSLGWITYTAVLEDDVLTFEERTYSEFGPADPCDTDEAEARGDSMPCVSYEMLAGVRQ